MAEIVDFVFDRTESDVDYAIGLKRKGWQNLTQEEKEDWMQGLKGCLNVSDLTRIENAVYAIGLMLGVEIESLKDNIPEIPTVSYFTQLLNNISKLHATGYVYLTTPEVPKLPINSYQKVNDIERILHDMHQRLSSEFYYHCGEEIYCGEKTGLLL